MKILAIEKELPGATSEGFKTLGIEEATHVWNLQKQGVVREIYFNQNKEALLVLECTGIKEAEQILSGFPFVKNSLIEFQLMELNTYTGLARLMK